MASDAAVSRRLWGVSFKPSAAAAGSKLSRRKLRFLSGVEFAEGKRVQMTLFVPDNQGVHPKRSLGSVLCAPGGLSPATLPPWCFFRVGAGYP